MPQTASTPTPTYDMILSVLSTFSDRVPVPLNSTYRLMTVTPADNSINILKIRSRVLLFKWITVRLRISKEVKASEKNQQGENRVSKEQTELARSKEQGAVSQTKIIR